MKRCFDLALKGRGATHPNPLVGSVIVHDDKIIGEGFHKAYGKAHAEVEAIQSVSDHSVLKNSTLYVNLEPCSHHGKTPPCADLIISKGIPTVVICNIDPHDKVAGSGIKKLEDYGIKVTTGVLKNEGQELNRSFFTFHTSKRPHIVLKWAQTSDGLMGRMEHQNNLSKAISNDTSNLYVHQLRAESGAILIGTNTAMQDNPSLTTRLVNGRNPLRVIVDLKAKIPNTHTLFTDGLPTLVIGPKRSNINVDYLEVNEETNIWPQLLEELYKRGVIQLLVEGGSHVLSQFIDYNNWDEIHVISSNVSWSEGISAPHVEHLQPESNFNLGKDLITIYRNK
jgi:diaminohydroxyphosphoribosylaminopyrimidine deaminase / 5-amino-6-(5-phosphoribosylamino)uracil reductase